MTAAQAHTSPTTSRIVWDKTQNKLMYDYISPRLGNGQSMRDLLMEAQVAVGIPEKEHRTWMGGSSANTTWEKIQRDAGIFPPTPSINQPVTTQTALSVPIVTVTPTSTVIEMTHDDAMRLIPCT